MAVRPHGKSATRAGGLALGHGGGGDPLGVSSSGSGSTARSARSSSSDRGDCVFRGKSATTLEGVASAGRCARRRSPERFAGDSPLERAGFEQSVPLTKEWYPRNCRDDAAIRCTGDARFRGPVKEHGLALLSPCGRSLPLGVEFALDAFFV